MRIGLGELLVVLAVALIVIGSDKLPDFARKCGKSLALFRKAYRDAASDLTDAQPEKHDEGDVIL